MTSEQAVNAGLVTELMTVVIQPSDPEEPRIIPPKFFGTYKLERKFGSPGYEFIVNQNFSHVESVSETFDNFEEMQKFGEEMKTAGVAVNFVDDYANILRITGDEAIKRDLIFHVDDRETDLQGSFEVSEGVAAFKQKAFLVKSSLDNSTNLKTNAVFTNIDELAKMIEKFLWIDSLVEYAEINGILRRDLNRNNLGYTQAFRDSLTPKPNLSERNVERNSTFWSDPEKYLTDFGDKMNRSQLSEQMQVNLGVQRFKSFQPPRLRNRF